MLEYSQRYDNALDYSQVFQDYARELALRSIERYDIRGKEIIEIGCGKGYFLTLLCELGNNRGTGFDPSYEGERMPVSDPRRLTYHRDLYGPQYTHIRGDLICCRHVFEHIAEPVGFLENVCRTLDGRRETVVYFEVPNVRFILEQMSVWDVIYEHCSCFGQESLAYVFRREGFDILSLADSYAGQFLGLEARLSAASVSSPAEPEPLDDLRATVGQFQDRWRELRERWQSELGRIKKRGQRCVVWGAGSKAVTFLTLMDGKGAVEYAVDINPHKQGLHLPGTGQRIVGPEFLREYRPEMVILMNRIYREEAGRQLKSLGLDPSLIDAC